MHSVLRYINVVLFVVTLTFFQSAQAEEHQQLADSAVANVFFDYDGSFEFASYKVDPKGFVDITFARNTPDSLYSEILNKLENHPDIDGVLAGKNGPTCSLF